MKLFMIKLGGGSAISDKSRPLSYREDWVRKLGTLFIKEFRSGNRFILVHGGGSFAHPMALAYGLNRYRDHDQLIGISLTSAVLNNLSMKITLTLALVGLPIYPLKTGSIYIIKDGKPPHLLIEPMHIIELIERGVIPMLYGDVVASDEDFSIISGDDIMLDLGSKLRPLASIFLTDVPGILDVNGNVIKQLTKASIVNERSTHHIDVTGGLMKKIQSAMELARYTRTYLCAIWDLESISRILHDEEPSKCTRFLPD